MKRSQFTIICLFVYSSVSSMIASEDCNAHLASQLEMYSDDQNRVGFKRGGEIVIYAQYAAAMPFSEGYACVLNSYLHGCRCCASKWGVINSLGKQVIEFKYGFIDPFSEGLAVAHSEKGCGLIRPSGEVVLPLEYELVDSMVNGLAVVFKSFYSDSPSAGYVNNKGVIAIPFSFSTASPFKHPDFACVSVGGKWRGNGEMILLDLRHGIINRKGEFVVSPEWDTAEIVIAPDNRAIAVVSDDGLWGATLLDKGASVTKINAASPSRLEALESTWEFDSSIPVESIPEKVSSQGAPFFRGERCRSMGETTDLPGKEGPN